MIIAYARVSTEQQSLDRQTDMLTQYGYDEIFTEKYTGTKASRPEFDKVNLMLRKGDVLVVESLSRVSRSTKDLLNILDDFEHMENAGKASYVERNQEMINKSDFCVVYYDENYAPPRRRNSRRDLTDYQPKSGTRLAYDYAVKKGKEIINVL